MTADNSEKTINGVDKTAEEFLVTVFIVGDHLRAAADAMRDALLQTLTVIADNLIKIKSVTSGYEKRIEIEWRAAITKSRKEKDEKRPVQKEPTGWIQETTLPGTLFALESS